MSSIILSRPAAGERSVLSLSQRDSILLSFYPEESHFSQNGNDLIAQFPDGGSIAVQGFFADGQTPGSITLSDGTDLNLSEFLERFAPDIAPPASSMASGSGVGEYEDSSGTVIGGVSSRLSILEDQDAGGGNSAFDDLGVLALETADEEMVSLPGVLHFGSETFEPGDIVDGILGDSLWGDPVTAGQFKTLSIDLTNSHEDTLDVDSLIVSLARQTGSDITSLVITGDNADVVHIPDDATLVKQDVMIEGMGDAGFDHYQCTVDSNTTVDLYVQMNVSANFA